jgi:hypothetical protein
MENNTVWCTDDYDAYVKNNNVHSGVYYCFALCEGLTVDCHDNVFEGFHVFDAANMNCYDNYFSVTNLKYERNTWRNIVNFTPDLQYVDILKSKKGTGGSRVYRDNTYIVEPSYADRFGEDRYLLRKKYGTWQTDIDSIIVEDNTFDMYILDFAFNVSWGTYYKFHGNKVHCDMMRSVGRQAYIYMRDWTSAETHVARQVIFTDNTIIYDSAPSGDAVGAETYRLVAYDTGGFDENTDLTTVTFTGNTITTYGLIQALGVPYANEATEILRYNSDDAEHSAEHMIINNNTIVNTE